MAGLNTPSPDLAVAQLWGRIIRPPLGADYPPPRKTPSQGRILRGKLRPLSGACALAVSRRGGLSGPPEGRIIRQGWKIRPKFRPPSGACACLGKGRGGLSAPGGAGLSAPKGRVIFPLFSKRAATLQHTLNDPWYCYLTHKTLGINKCSFTNKGGNFIKNNNGKRRRPTWKLNSATLEEVDNSEHAVIGALNILTNPEFFLFDTS